MNFEKYMIVASAPRTSLGFLFVYIENLTANTISAKTLNTIQAI